MNDRNLRPTFLALAALAALTLAATAAAQAARSKPSPQAKKAAPGAAPKATPEKKAPVADHRRHRGPGVMGEGVSGRVRDLPEDRRHGAHQVRRQRGAPARADQGRPAHGVSQSKIEEDPRLKTMWQGYAFAADFREERGHAYMLEDQTYTQAPGRS